MSEKQHDPLVALVGVFMGCLIPIVVLFLAMARESAHVLAYIVGAAAVMVIFLGYFAYKRDIHKKSDADTGQ